MTQQEFESPNMNLGYVTCHIRFYFAVLGGREGGGGDLPETEPCR